MTRSTSRFFSFISTRSVRAGPAGLSLERNPEKVKGLEHKKLRKNDTM